MQEREAIVQQQHRLIDKNRHLKSIKDKVVKREFELRRKLQEMQELAKFVEGREFEREVEILKEEHEAMMDLVVEVKEKRETVSRAGKIASVNADIEHLKADICDLRMQKVVQLNERKRLRQQMDAFQAYLEQLQAHKLSLEEQLQPVEVQAQRDQQTPELVESILELQFDPPLTDEQLRWLHEGNLPLFIHSLTLRSKELQQQTRIKEAQLKKSHAELQYLQRKGREMGQRDAQEYAQLQKEDEELAVEIAKLQEEIRKDDQVAEAESQNRQQKAQLQSLREVKQWEQRKVDAIDNNRLMIRNYLELCLTNNNPSEINEIGEELQRLEEELSHIKE